MTLFLPKLTSTRSNAFLNVDVSLNDYSSPLHVQNKANSRATFSTERELQFMAYEELKKGYSQYFGTPINKKLVKP